MKKLIGLTLSCIAMSCSAAPTTVGVVWPFNIGSTQANYSRALISAANKSQSKYSFVLENKPGAGSSIAANYVAGNNRPTIMAATSSFFIRPNFFPNSSHDIDQFVPLMIQCAVPMIVVSKKYSSFKDIPKDKRITIGVSGLGATTHLLTAELKKTYTGIEAVPYQGTMAPINDMLGGNLDMAVGFPGELKQFIDSKQVNVMGISGPDSLPGMRTFKSQGFMGSEKVINTHFLAIPKTVSPDVSKELQSILMEASKSNLVRNAYAIDDCIDGNTTPANTVKWFDEQAKYWKTVTSGVKIN